MRINMLYYTMFDNKIKCYVARGMTGLVAADVVAQAKADKDFLEKAGFEVLCPVTSEGVKSSQKPIQSTKKQMDTYWGRDKAMIREAHVVFNMSPHLPSIGVIREHGYARYFLWKKVLSVFPEGKMPKEGAVCYYEDDFVTDSLLLAIGEAYRTHGSWFKRFNWRLNVYRKSLLKAMIYKLQEWWK